MSEIARRETCAYVYCRKVFTTTSLRERYCCREHMLAQQRYKSRRRYAEAQKKAAEACHD